MYEKRMEGRYRKALRVEILKNRVGIAIIIEIKKAINCKVHHCISIPVMFE